MAWLIAVLALFLYRGGRKRGGGNRADAVPP
jgi:hypothetical protein